MLIRSGKWSGRHARLHQWANDWISADVIMSDGSTKAVILNPTTVQLGPDEAKQMEESKASTSIGFFWQAWILTETGRIVRNQTFRSPYRRRQ